MKRLTLAMAVLVAAVLSLPAGVANADFKTGDHLDALAALKGADVLAKIAAAGGRIDELKVQRLDNGMLNVSIPMSEQARRSFAKQGAGAERAKDLQTLGLFASILPQDFEAQIASADLAPLTGIEYFYYFATANFGNDTIKKAVFQLKGRGGFKSSEQLLFHGGFFDLFVLEHTVDDFGPRKFQIKVSGAGGGTLKQNLCFDCAA